MNYGGLTDYIWNDFIHNIVDTALTEDDYHYDIRIVPWKEDENTPKCPTCNSTNIEKIGATNKIGSMALFGIFSVGHVSKTFSCQKCGYKW